MIITRILTEAPPGTVIPKPDARRPFYVKGRGTRRGEPALIYTIPNHRDPRHPYEKGVTANEFEAAYGELLATGELTHRWFNEHLSACAAEGPCNFTTIGGLFQRLGLAEYVPRGVYRRVGGSKKRDA
jgi:hypothetical protein